jgi:hypothetical protein
MYTYAIIAIMKKLAKILSTILAVTILVGLVWYFFPAEKVKSGAKSLSKSASDILDKLSDDNVHADAVKVDDGSASNEGDIGAELTFSSSSCPYRALLSISQQGVYNQIYANARDMSGTFKLVCPLSADELNDAYVAVICDHPEIFWLENSYQYGYASSDKDTAVQMTLKYNALKSRVNSAKRDFNTEAEKICAGAQKYGSSADKEKYVFEALAGLISYSDGAKYNQTSYSGLVCHSTVCAGYARSLQYILNKLGIPCYYIYGTANGEYHAWNIVQLGGEWYNVDLTWCDQDTGAAYTYYNVTDAVLSANHTRGGLSQKLPAAAGTKYAVTPKKEAADTAAPSSGTPAAQTDANVVKSLNDYNSVCYSQIVAHGPGTYSFSMTLGSEALYDEIVAASKRRDYEAGYLADAAAELGLEKYSYDYSIAGDLNDYNGLVVLTQTVKLSD